jgi:hypothetical protein
MVTLPVDIVRGMYLHMFKLYDFFLSVFEGEMIFCLNNNHRSIRISDPSHLEE